MSDKPFSGLKVVDLTQGLAGPWCAMTLAHHGADVVKIEPPEGDWSRTIAPKFGDISTSFITCNRGKRAIVVDLKTKEGVAVVQRLASTADVFLESNRAGIAARLGVGYEQLSKTNPGLVYLSVTGFGQTGPNASRPVTDSIIQAFSGFMWRNVDDDGMPRRVDFPIPDYTTGMMAYQTLVTALYRRMRTGKGQHIDLSLMQSLLAYQQHGIMHETLDPSPRVGAFPPTGSYRVKDGAINFSIIREKHFPALCRALGRPELAADARFATLEDRRINEVALKQVITEAFADKEAVPLCQRLEAEDVPHGKVNTYADALHDPHVKELGTVSWVEREGIGNMPFVNFAASAPLTADDPRVRVPHLGEDTDAVLADRGWSAAEIASLRAAGAVRG